MYGFISMFIFLFILTIAFVMSDLRVPLIDINKNFMDNKSIYFLSNILSVMPSYLDLVVHKRDKLIIYINPSKFIYVVTFLLKSTQFKFVQLLDV